MSAYAFRMASELVDRLRAMTCAPSIAFAIVVTVISLPTPQVHAAREHITLGVRLEPPHLDPTAGAAAAIDEITYANIFEGLTRIDRTGTVQPWLAERWEVSEDGLEYIFHLRDGVAFHDGTPFDAETAVFSLNRIVAERSVNAQKALYADIATVEAVTPLSLKVTLSRPNGAFLFYLGWGDAAMIAPSSAETNKVNPVGTGPFKFARWVQGDRLEMKRNPTYWGDAPALETATFKIVGDAVAAFAALMAEDIDAFPVFPAPETIPQIAADPRFTVAIGTTEGETILAINNHAGPLADRRVRQALSHAVDRQAIINGAMFGFGAPIGSHFAPHHPAHVDLTGAYAYDPQRARALIAEAGYPDGFAVTLKLPPPEYARRSGEIAAAQLRAIGVEVEIVPLGWAQWLSEVFTDKNFDLTIVSHTEPLDIGIYARDDYYFQYYNPDFNALMERLEVTLDTQTRHILMENAQRILSDDAVNVFLFQLAKLGVWNAKVRGLWENAPIQANDLTQVRWTE